MTSNQLHKTLDSIRLYCSEPVFKTRIERNKMIDGGILKVLTNDPVSEEDIAGLIKHIGYKPVFMRYARYNFINLGRVLSDLWR